MNKTFFHALNNINIQADSERYSFSEKFRKLFGKDYGDRSLYITNKRTDPDKFYNYLS